MELSPVLILIHHGPKYVPQDHFFQISVACVTHVRKLRIYNSIVKRAVTFKAETRKFNKHLKSKLMSMEMDA